MMQRTKRITTWKITSMLILLSNLLRLARGPLLFRRDFVSCPAKIKRPIRVLLPWTLQLTCIHHHTNHSRSVSYQTAAQQEVVFVDADGAALFSFTEMNRIPKQRWLPCFDYTPYNWGFFQDNYTNFESILENWKSIYLTSVVVQCSLWKWWGRRPLWNIHVLKKPAIQYNFA